ncbi:hypothetical protein [Shewanella sp. GutDb-MelDb]|uniref:hypothetical protein n=1 Tax=Shewanella sp. GutDb-MelDb TaxID=2058316 RepID=UPI000C7C08E2|nr:hypothetical protein [Shewanella sp. GutDb-MelDb]PKG56329.1 hypothetical protein CXF82_15300 [Shewanella sp. GutDb-MelDb]
MQVVTNYPNVPLSTSNVATDAARTDNQQRPPVLPPPQASKGHEERAFNPQHERTAEQAQTQAKLRGSVQGKQQGDSQQEQQKRPAPFDLKQLLSYRSSLKRSDIKLPSLPVEKPACADSKRMPNETLQFYRAFGAHIDAFYQARTQPKTESDMLTSV